VLALDEGAERARARDVEGSDRIGARSDEYHRKVAAAFETVASNEPARVRMVDSSGAPEDVTERLLEAIKDLLP
jgi:dTMP kinase